MPNLIPHSPINDGAYRLYALHLNMSEYIYENDIGIFSDNINGVYMSCIGPKYYQSYLQSKNIELASLQLMQICNYKCLRMHKGF